MAIIWGNPPLAIAVNALQRLVDVAVRPGRGDEKAVVFLRDTVAIDATVSRRRKFYERRNIVAIREGIGAHFSYICNFEGYNMASQHFYPPFSPLRIWRGDSGLFSPR